VLSVTLIFLASCGSTLWLTLRQPVLRLRVGRRELRIETYFLGALVGPLLILAAGLLSAQDMVNGLRGQTGLEPVGILTLFLSMVFMSIFLDHTGFFEACARWALRYARGEGTRLFFATYAIVSLLTMFTSNDIVVLTFTPFIYYFARHAGLNPKPYLLAEFFAANTWSMMLYIGNPTNILVASAFGFTFVEYTRWMLGPTLAAGLVNAVVLYTIFRKEIAGKLQPVEVNPWEAIRDKPGTWMGLTVLGGCVVALALAPYVGWAMWKVSLAFALALLGLLVLREVGSWPRRPVDLARSPLYITARRMPWSIVPFVLSLFVTVYALRVYGVTGLLGSALQRASGGIPAMLAVLYGWASALAANLLNNIPMTLAFTSAVGTQTAAGTWAGALGTVVGSNLGANLTPLGALAGIMWMAILAGKEERVSFGEFVRYGLLTTPLALAACLGVLALQFALGM